MRKGGPVYQFPCDWKQKAEAWRKYLQKNLNATVPVDSGAQAGTYTVQVKFLVDKNGGVSSIKALTSHGYGMEEEVIRFIAKGPKWIPAKQNGHIVNAFKTQAVTFVITEEEDEKEPVITNETEQRNDSQYFPKISLRDLQRVNPEYLLCVNLQEIVSFRYSTDSKEGIMHESVNAGN